MADKAREWTTFGRYVLLEKIGTGGMAEIFRAKTFGAAGFEKEFAIKLILPWLVDDKEFVDMFINEAKISVSLYHANIVQVFDLGQIEGQYYIAMEFVHGKDMLDVLACCAELDIRMPLHIVLFITMEMLKGLDFAHRAKDSFGDDLNIIHRDVSPSNVLISYAGDVKIGDFGVAKAAIQRNLTENGTLKGKVGYMSPEQVMGDNIDARSDIFSAGIVFFEALCMNRLFVGSSDLDVMLRVRDADIGDALEQIGPMPSDLLDIVHRALAKHRQERFQTAGEFYQALVDFCFRHDIKVGEAELSNFMRRLFVEEIAREKTRRRSDPHAPVASILARPGDSVPVPARGQGSDSFVDGPMLTRIGQGDAAPRRYRFRTGGGEVHGPMTLTSLIALVNKTPAETGERVSRDGEEWLKLEAFEEFSDVFRDRPAPARSDVGHNQLEGAAVFKSRRLREVGATEDVPADLALTRTELSPALLAEGLGDSASEPTEPEDVHTGALLSVLEVVAMRDRYDLHEGTFNDLSFARMLARLHRNRSTGRLYTRSGEVEKSIFFRDGEIILVASNRKEELLGSFLRSRDIISQEQLEDGLARLSEWGGRLGDALVATGAIPAHEIFRLLSEQMAEKLLHIFSWTEGEFGYFENQEPEMHAYPLDVDCYDILVRGCRERVPLHHLKNIYRARRQSSIRMRSPAPFDLTELRMRGNELRVATSVQEGMSLQRLLHVFPPQQSEFVYRVIYLLHQSELLAFDTTTSSDVEFPGS